jgi:hypothetical protein
MNMLLMSDIFYDPEEMPTARHWRPRWKTGSRSLIVAFSKQRLSEESVRTFTPGTCAYLDA